MLLAGSARGEQLGLSAPSAQASGYEERLVQVEVNLRVARESALVLLGSAGDVLVAEEDMRLWRVRVPVAQAVVQGERRYLPLSALPGSQVRFDEATQTLKLELAATAFEDQSFDGSRAVLRPPPLSHAGGFLNYDLLAQGGASDRRLSASFEAAVFNRQGAGVTTFLVNSSAERRFTRLDTHWTFDGPERLASLRVGDAVLRPATAWGRSVRLGGIQYSTDFGLQPGFVSLPQRGVAGEAVLPSTVDVFVNNALISRREVQPGPFSVNNLPIVTGAGELRAVVRDVLGREQVLSQPFFASTRLLRKGVVDFSFEAGKVRENYGLASNDYGRSFAAATWRQGLTDGLTGELHGEASKAQRTVGGNLAMNLLERGVLNLSLAGSQGERGRGLLAGAGVETQRSPFSAGFRVLAASEGFDQIGLPANRLAPRLRQDANLGWSAGRLGSFSATYVKQLERDADSVRLISLSWSRRLGPSAHFGLTALRPLEGGAATSVSAFLMISLDARTTANASMQHAQGGGSGAGASSQSSLLLQRSLTRDDGFGYRLQGSDAGPVQAEVSAQNQVGRYVVAAANQNGQTAVRASVSGGLAALGGSVHASRRITDSFAVVQVPDQPGVLVFADNQPVGRTDSRGSVLVTGVRAFERNPLRIDVKDLPMDVKVDALEREAIPWRRSGVLVRFPVARVKAAMLRLALADGRPMPLEASVRLDGQGEAIPVVNDGELYLEDVGERFVLDVEWRGQSCRLELKRPQTDDPMPHLGTHTCGGMK